MSKMKHAGICFQGQDRNFFSCKTAICLLYSYKWQPELGTYPEAGFEGGGGLLVEGDCAPLFFFLTCCKLKKSFKVKIPELPSAAYTQVLLSEILTIPKPVAGGSVPPARGAKNHLSTKRCTMRLPLAPKGRLAAKLGCFKSQLKAFLSSSLFKCLRLNVHSTKHGSF